MYKYSKKAQERFLSFPFFAYLLAWFSKSQEGTNFVMEKYSDKGEEYIEKMMYELNVLKEEAIQSIWQFTEKKGDYTL
jgi:hypothetical protein